MNHKTFALGALSALALSAQAQVYNWTLTSSDPSLGNGSGQFTLTSGVVTAMSGTIGGQSGTLMAPGFYGPNQLWNVSNNYALYSAIGFLLPGRTYSGIYFNPGDPMSLIDPYVEWFDSTVAGKIPINAFGVTPVPEPSTWAMGVVFGVGAMVTVGMRRRQAAKV